MSDADYQKECMYCKQQITMSKHTGKWLPHNGDGKPHDCRQKKLETPITQPDRAAKIAHVIQMIQSVVKELEQLK